MQITIRLVLLIIDNNLAIKRETRKIVCGTETCTTVELSLAVPRREQRKLIPAKVGPMFDTGHLFLIVVK